MCIIIHRPAQNALSLDTLKACAEQNKDGWGIMMQTPQGIEKYNGLLLNDFLDVYESIPKDLEMAIHFRFKTHGDIDIRNTHPYVVLEKEKDGVDMLLMHNGVISIKQHDKTMSDTWHWVELVLKPIMLKVPELINDHAFKFLLEASVGNSRLLILDERGKFHYLNEDAWTINKDQKDGCSYSTTIPKKYVYAPPKTTQQGTHQYGGTSASGYPAYRQEYQGKNYYGGYYGDEKDETNVIGIPKNGGGTDNGSKRFQTEAFVQKTGTKLLAVPERGETSPGIVPTTIEGNVEVDYNNDLTDKQLAEMEIQAMQDQGVFLSSESYLGLEFTPQRTHLLQYDHNACDNFQAIDEMYFSGVSFEEICAFVQCSPEEAALFIYRNFS